MTILAAQQIESQKTAQFKQRAMMRAQRDGVARAAQDFGIATPMLYSWLENAHMEDEVAFLINSVF